MKLFDFDAYESMTRFMDPKDHCVIVDVGANDGAMISRALFEFPNAKIYAFEPSPEPLAKLQLAFRNDKRVSIQPFACGNSSGLVTLNITRDPYCSSLLRPSELGTHFYGDRYDVVQQVTVPRVSLDDWARDNKVARIDFLKIDTQGHDLEVLRGAQRLIASGQIKAVNAEAEFAPEYEGATNFREIDGFFASCGFMLHQIHEIVAAGAEAQSSYSDALWVRESELKTLRARKDVPIFGLGARLARALKECDHQGRSRFALYGAGLHTQRAIKVLADRKSLPLVIADDRAELWGQEVDGVRIVEPKSLQAMGVQAVVLSSDRFERELWERSKLLREQGLAVFPLYKTYAA